MGHVLTLSKLSFFGDYNNIEIKNAEMFTKLVAYFTKEELMPNTVQEVTMQVKIDKNKIDNTNVPTQVINLRPAFFSPINGWNIIIGTERIDIEKTKDNNNSTEFFSKATDYIKKMEDICHIRHKRLAVNLKYEISDNIEEIQQKIFSTQLSYYKNNLKRWQVQLFTTEENNSLFESKSIRINIFSTFIKKENDGRKINFLFDFNTDASEINDIYESKNILELVKSANEKIETLMIDMGLK